MKPRERRAVDEWLGVYFVGDNRSLGSQCDIVTTKQVEREGKEDGEQERDE